MAAEVLSPVRSGLLNLSPSHSQSVRGSSPKTLLASSPSRAQGTPSGRSPVAETPGSTAQAVASALERDLENERRERIEQVGFLNKSFTQEKDLLVRRTEAVERQLVESRRSWFDERTLLTQKLQASEASSGDRALRQAEQSEAAVLQASREEGIRFATALEKAEKFAEVRLETERAQLEAQNVKYVEGYDSLLLKTARLEVEVESERNVAQKASEKERVAVLRVATLEAEREQLILAHNERLREATANLTWAQDEVTRQAQKAAEESASLRLEIQQMEAARSRLELDSDLRQQQAVAAEARSVAERTASKVRQECEDGGKESMLRAIWQLQSADDCMHTMRQQQLQEASECTSQRQENAELKRRLVDEHEQSQRLAASLANAHSEQRELMSRLRAVEQDLETERLEVAAYREANRGAASAATRDRLDRLSTFEQTRVRSRLPDTSYGEPTIGRQEFVNTSTSSQLARLLREGARTSSPNATLRPSRLFTTDGSQFEKTLLSDEGVVSTRDKAMGSLQLDASCEKEGLNYKHDLSLRPAWESYADFPASATDRRNALAWPVNQLEAPLAAAAELEHRLWGRLEPPPQWRSLAAPAHHSNTALPQPRTQLPIDATSATSNTLDSPWLSGLQYRSNV